MKKQQVLLYLLIISLFISSGILTKEITSRVIVTRETTNLTRVIDGDTIETSIGKVRLLGINTPEKNTAYSEQAKAFLKNFEGKQIQIEKTSEDKDKYGRYLRYVYYDSLFINQEILKRGLAHLYVYTTDKNTRTLEKAEKAAQENELGIWEKSQEKCSKCIILKELNYIDPGEYVLLENICSFPCDLNAWKIKDDSTKMRILNMTISEYSKYKINYQGKIWNDAGDSLYLRDSSGKLVILYRYKNN